MRSALFCAALLLGTAAIAQPATNDDQPVDETMTDAERTGQTAPQPVQTGPARDTRPTGHSGSMGQTGTTGHAGHTGMAGTGTVAPANTNPETDARGIPVISAPAVAPAGWNQPYGTGTPAPANQPAQSMGAATDLPPCSRTVTDRCVQTYERGVGRPR